MTPEEIRSTINTAAVIGSICLLMYCFDLSPNDLVKKFILLVMWCVGELSRL